MHPRNEVTRELHALFLPKGGKPSGRPQTRQWTIDPRDGRPRGFAFVWRRYAIEGQPAPLPFCVMATAGADRFTPEPQPA